MILKRLQIIRWNRPMRFGKPPFFNKVAGYYLIYKWAFLFGIWEFRWFISKKVRIKKNKQTENYNTFQI